MFNKYFGKMFKIKTLLDIFRKLKKSTASYSTNKIKPVEMSYDLYGSGTAPPLIILHSLCGNKSNWRSISLMLQDKLNPSRKIYTIDARNHGTSNHSNKHSYEHITEDVAHFLKNQKINKATVMGHSMGGRAMMYLALKYPNLVDRAIILDVSPIDTIPYADLTYSKIVLAIMKNTSLLPNMSLAENRAFVGERMRQIISKEFAINFLLQNLEETSNKERYGWALNVDALQKYVNKLEMFPKSILENKCLSPVLFIGGSYSHFINRDHWPNIQQSFPNSTLNWVDAGHLIHIEKPTEVVNLVSKFLNEIKK